MLILPVLLTAVLVVVAYALSARRDLGAGLLPARLGAASASPSLNSPLSLAWRLNQGALYAWAGGAAAFGFLLGTVGVSISKFVDAPQLQDWVTRMGAQNAGDAFLFIVMYVLGQVISAYAISAALRLRSEETSGRADPVLATPVSRLSWAASHLFFAIIGPTILLVVMGLTIGLGYGLASGDMAADLSRLFFRTLVTLPAVWVMAGIATLFYGFAPRFAAAITWGLFAAFLILELFWEVGQINQTVFNLSPFAHVHWALQVSATPLIGLTLVAAALTAAGLVGLRRRDLV